ncbi:zinc-binding dehydrogenase [Nakamurella aerolata]|uniref:Alcohol dehydrogenase catalytic domain-containing protein n=1 Tax=Nakamurella aerolata TaxID=1656892 RepID=A0A849A773_9ACTN|nr:alcohol dehydrogenase catalytic domain-containing protein [Nakamurella aerolata]NNG36409.1 alcohol dehydrogenase catalytic domain-containing protein [Nakamurella aerolata]
MRALLYREFSGPITVAEVAEPAAEPGTAVVRVAASGICRSDWHAWSGHDDSVPLPQVPGHEFAGTVAAAGPGVDPGWIGRRVTAPFVNGCGRCDWCRAGQAQVCPFQTQPGFTHRGSHAELVAVRAADTNLVALPDEVSDRAAAALGCRFATAFRALTAHAQLAAGQWVVVYGAGGVGLSAVMIGAALGAQVAVVDRSAAALQLAGRLGAAAVVPAGADATAMVLDVTGGGAHVSVDAVGSPDTARDAVFSLRRRGRHVQVGLFADQLPVLPMDRVIAWELSVFGSHGMAAADYPALLELVRSRTLRPDALLGEPVDLADAAPLIVNGTPAGITVLDPNR